VRIGFKLFIDPKMSPELKSGLDNESAVPKIRINQVFQHISWFYHFRVFIELGCVLMLDPDPLPGEEVSGLDE